MVAAAVVVVVVVLGGSGGGGGGDGGACLLASKQEREWDRNILEDERGRLSQQLGYVHLPRPQVPVHVRRDLPTPTAPAPVTLDHSLLQILAIDCAHHTAACSFKTDCQPAWGKHESSKRPWNSTNGGAHQ